jgi:hypothetical protein
MMTRPGLGNQLFPQLEEASCLAAHASSRLQPHLLTLVLPLALTVPLEAPTVALEAIPSVLTSCLGGLPQS